MITLGRGGEPCTPTPALYPSTGRRRQARGAGQAPVWMRPVGAPGAAFLTCRRGGYSLEVTSRAACTLHA